MSTATRYAVALQGFSEFERSALASFFRLAARRTPTYVQVGSAEQSDFLIADADRATALDAVVAAGRSADTVFVGAHAPEGATAWLRRPIDPMRIVRELDLLVAQRTGAAGRRAVDPALQPQVDLLIADIDLPARPMAGSGTTFAGGGGRDVMVADDSAIARKFLMLRLQQFGYRVHACHDGDQAMDLVARHSFAIVFLDVVLGPPGSVDGFRVCQFVKQQAPRPGAAPTAVVLVTGLAGSSDRVRGTLAGCDAYLVKPLLEADFIRTLHEVDPRFIVAPPLPA